MNNLQQLDFQGKNVKEIPMVEIVFEIFKVAKNTYHFNELVKEIVRLKEIPEDQSTNYMVQLFTEMNIDGRFIHLGQGEWGLKRWYPADPTDFLVYSRDEDEESIDYDDDDDDDFNGDDLEDESDEESDDEDLDDDDDDEDDEDVEFEDDDAEIIDEEVSLDDDDEELYDDEELSYEDDVDVDEEEAEDLEEEV